jgi:N-acetylneuraminate synthase
MVFIIAEIGTNHLGDVNIAKQIIDVAVNAGCDAVKFQKNDVEKIYAKKFLDSPLASPWGTTQREMRLHVEFSEKQFREISLHCKKRQIHWFVSCWDVGSQIHMRKFKTRYNQIDSDVLTHQSLVETIAKEKKHTFISTGMNPMKEVSNAVKIFRKNKCSFELMHSHGSFPMSLNEVNIRQIPIIQKKFKCNVGYNGYEKVAYLACVMAVMFGATSIERHVTIDRTSYGHDQPASLEPLGLEKMIRNVRLVENILGDGKKRIWDSELPAMKKLRQRFT